MVDMPPAFQPIARVAMRALKKTTRDKFVFCTSAGALEFLEELGCDEETLRTAARSMENRRQKDRQVWFTSVEHSFFKENLRDLGLSEDTEAWTPIHHRR